MSDLVAEYGHLAQTPCTNMSRLAGYVGFGFLFKCPKYSEQKPRV